MAVEPTGLSSDQAKSCSAPANHKTVQQPSLQLITTEAWGHPRKDTVSDGQHRNLQVVAGADRLGGGGSIDIDNFQMEIHLGEVKHPQALLKPLAKAAALTAVKTELSHQSGTGSQPQGVKGWHRSSRLMVSQPPRQGP